VHERSFVSNLIAQVLDEQRRRQLGRLHGIRLELGEFSGFEPQLVELAFEELAAHFWKGPVRLELSVVMLSAECLNCATLFRVESFRFVCPACSSSSVRITSGNETRLVSLDVEPIGIHEESMS